MDYRELYQKAAAVLPNAFVPFSNYRVGAALLTKSGEVFTGVNVENSSYGGAICAERTACVKAVSEGFHEFEAIAVAENREKPLRAESAASFSMNLRRTLP